TAGVVAVPEAVVDHGQEGQVEAVRSHVVCRSTSAPTGSAKCERQGGWVRPCRPPGGRRRGFFVASLSRMEVRAQSIYVMDTNETPNTPRRGPDRDPAEGAGAREDRADWR